jgi:hypothetical protein
LNNTKCAVCSKTWAMKEDGIHSLEIREDDNQVDMGSDAEDRKRNEELRQRLAVVSVSDRVARKVKVQSWIVLCPYQVVLPVNLVDVM